MGFFFFFLNIQRLIKKATDWTHYPVFLMFGGKKKETGSFGFTLNPNISLQDQRFLRISERVCVGGVEHACVCVGTYVYVQQLMCQLSFPSFPVNGAFLLLFLFFFFLHHGLFIRKRSQGFEVIDRIPHGSFPPKEGVYFLLFGNCLSHQSRKEDRETKARKEEEEGGRMERKVVGGPGGSGLAQRWRRMKTPKELAANSLNPGYH